MQVLLSTFTSLLSLVAFVAAASYQETCSIGFAKGTTGGSGGSITTVNSLSALQSAVSGTGSKIVLISGSITGAATVSIGNNTSVLGLPGSSLNGIGLSVKSNNVIIRNVKISKVVGGDAIAVQSCSRVWIDHVDVSSDMTHDKDYYDGLIDITHEPTNVTVSYSLIHDHFKTSLVGASDTNTGDVKISVSYAYNYWRNVGSRTPSFRFGTGHIWNNYYEGNSDGINTRVAAQLLVENNVWRNCKNSVYSTSSGYAVVRGSDYGNATANSAPTGTFTTPPYSYSLIATGSVISTVQANAGQKLSWS